MVLYMCPLTMYVSSYDLTYKILFARSLRMVLWLICIIRYGVKHKIMIMYIIMYIIIYDIEHMIIIV
jgi:hypothetical protein